jgi:hypothetical protein
MLAVGCRFQTAADDVERCMPVDDEISPTPAVVALFTDNTCVPTVKVGVLAPDCYQGDPKYGVETVDGHVHAYAITGPAGGPLFKNDGGCMQITDLSSYWALGAEVPADTFVGSEVAPE